MVESVKLQTRQDYAEWLAGDGLSLDRAAESYVQIAVPVASRPEAAFCASLVETVSLLDYLRIRFEFQMAVGISDICVARNKLVDRFLRSPCTDMLFIDADMQWEASSVVRLLASDKPLIAGVGRRKNETPSGQLEAWCFSGIIGTENCMREDAAGAVEVDAVGTAFMKINRQVFFDIHEKLGLNILRRANVPKEGETQQYYHKFFAVSDVPTADGFIDEHSEDFTFCRRYRSVGGEVWIDPKIPMGHIGIHNYAGCVGALFEPAEDSGQ